MLKNKVLEWTGFKSTSDMLVRREYVAQAIQDDVQRIAGAVGVATPLDVKSYFSQIPTDANNQVQLAYVGKRVNDLKSLLDQAETLTPIMQAISKELPKLTQQVSRSRNNVRRTLADLRRDLSRNKELAKSSLNDYASKIELEGNFTQNLETLSAHLKKLTAALSGEQSAELLSLSEQFRAIAVECSNVQTQFKDVMKTDDNLSALNSRLATFLKGSLNNTASIDVSELNVLLKDSSLDVSDAQMVEEIGNPVFLATYTRYVTNVQTLSGFVLALNNILKALRTNISSLGLWHQRVQAVVAANLVSDLAQYQAFISNHPGVVKGDIELTRGSDGKPDWELTKYDESLDDFGWDTVTGKGVQALLQADVGKIKTRVNNLLRSLSLRTI